MVFNKIDLLLEDEAKELCDQIATALEVENYYQISAFQKLNVDDLCRDIMNYIETLPVEELTEEEEVEFQWDSYHERVIAEHSDVEDDDDDWDDEDDHPNVVYTNE